MTIPVIDFKELGLDAQDNDLKISVEVTRLAKQLVDICSTVGFVYLKNHGITRHEIEKSSKLADDFFCLPQEVKNRYTACLKTDGEHGWVSVGMERVNPKFEDIKECLNVVPYLGKVWPDDVTPGYKQTQMGFFRRCDQLAHRVLKALAIGLELKNPAFFNEAHNYQDKPNRTTLRFLYYPSVNKKELRADQVILGEHTDKGSITLLFQDNTGGLEVQSVDETWTSATPIPGTVLVNIGDAMQRWTAGKLVSTPHRLFNMPVDDNGMTRERRSIAFFMSPDEDVKIGYLDGVSTVPAESQKTYLDKMLRETYPNSH